MIYMTRTKCSRVIVYVSIFILNSTWFEKKKFPLIVFRELVSKNGYLGKFSW